MSQLANIQAGFQAFLFDSEKASDFKTRIVNDAKVGAEQRLEIYYNAYRLRIIEALANAYPNLKALLGDDWFDRIARSYIDEYPSTYRNMRWVGDQMAVHLAKELPEHPIAAEMAAFEWALGLAFDVEDAPVLSLQDLAGIPPESWPGLIFKLHPSVQLLALNWNVLLVWQALDNGQIPPPAERIDEPCVVWRKGMDSHYRALDDKEYKAIQQISAGSNFGELCERLQENTDEEAATALAAQYLAGWLDAGLMSTIQSFSL